MTGQPLREGLEITPAEAAAWLASGRVVVDIRTPEELEKARVPGSEWLPMGDLLARIDELDLGPGEPFAVLCHHGVRSLKMTLALHAVGHAGARSVAGGIEAWSLEVDPSVPRYVR